MHSSAKRIALLMALAFVVLLPAANAQLQATLTISQPADALNIQPDTGTGPTKFKLTYSFTNPAQTPLGVVQTSVVINVNVQCPNNVIANFPSSVIIPLSVNAQNTNRFESADVPVSIAISKDHPGLKQVQCEVTASAPAVGSQQTAGAVEAPATKFAVSSGYFPLIQAKLVDKILEAGPQKSIPFQIELTNFGNAQTKVRFQLATEDVGKWNPVLPDITTLDSTASGGGAVSSTVPFSIATPFKNGWNNEEKSFQLTMTPIATQDETRTGTPIDATVLARVRGIYIPGFEAVAMLGALVAAVAHVRRN
ncbi:MAG: hypothetical protein AABX89_04670 [Candidatus Thermoplasmatota archaeon]